MRKLTSATPGLILVFLTSACGNSPANSGAASSAARNPVAGGDRYYEYAINSTGGPMTIQGSSKLYLSSKGDIRTEMAMTNSMEKKPGSPIIAIGHSDKPNESILIDDDTKTYTIHNIKRDSTSQPGTGDCSATKIGEEDIAGFHAIHARIINVRSFGSFIKMTDTIDLWKSPDVPVESTFKDKMDQFENKTGNYLYTPQVAVKLQAMGCEGFLVKLEVRSKRTKLTQLLVKTEQRSLPASLFEVPAGYKKTADD